MFNEQAEITLPILKVNLTLRIQFVGTRDPTPSQPESSMNKLDLLVLALTSELFITV